MGLLSARTWELDRSPLYNDEAAYGMDGLAAQHGDLRVFYARNNGREPLFIYLLALAFQSLGATAYAIRLTAAVVGAATVVTTYCFVRELFRCPNTTNRRRVGTPGLGGAFLTFAYWHLSLSRVGSRHHAAAGADARLRPLLVVWRGLRTPGAVPWGWAILAGLALSLPLYTYTAGRTTPLLFAITVAMTWRLANRFAIDRGVPAQNRLRDGAGDDSGRAAAAELFCAAPGGIWRGRVEVSVLNTQYAGDNPLLALLASTARSLLLFGVLPDGNLRHNPAGIPVLDPLLAAWLLLGVGLALFYWRRLTTSFALAWFALLLAPAILSSEGAPHSLRMIGLTPIAAVLPVLAMGWVAGRAPRRWAPALRWLPLPFLLVAAFLGVTSYFGVWSPIERFRGAFGTDYADFARTLAASDTAETLRVLPLVDADALTDGKFNTIDFFQRDPGAFATLPVEEATAAAELERLSVGGALSTCCVPAMRPISRRLRGSSPTCRGCSTCCCGATAPRRLPLIGKWRGFPP